MTQPRNDQQRERTSGPQADASHPTRPLSARSVIASVLLGIDPPRLSSQQLVRSGSVFGISEGTTRVALSRMCGAGELRQDSEGAYVLAGPLLERHGRQFASRAARHREWDGEWEQAVVVADRRDPSSRAELRDAMRHLKLAELREGVWLRPDNLDPARATEGAAIVDEQCLRLRASVADPATLAATLWDLDAWATTAASFFASLQDSQRRLEAGDTGHLAEAFVMMAGVLRHFVADPELPDELLPASWPGAALREHYEAVDAAFKALWRDWFRSQQ